MLDAAIAKEVASGSSLGTRYRSYNLTVYTALDSDEPLQRGSTDLVEPGPRRAKDMMEGGNLYSPTIS